MSRFDPFGSASAVPVAIRFELPWPPSVNDYWRSSHVARRVHRTEEAKSYATRAALRMLEQRVPRLGLDSAIQVTVVVRPPCASRRRDLDNVLKATLDALVAYRLVSDDSRVDRIVVERGAPHASGGALELAVETM